MNTEVLINEIIKLEEEIYGAGLGGYTKELLKKKSHDELMLIYMKDKSAVEELRKLRAYKEIIVSEIVSLAAQLNAEGKPCSFVVTTSMPANVLESLRDHLRQELEKIQKQKADEQKEQESKKNNKLEEKDGKYNKEGNKKGKEEKEYIEGILRNVVKCSKQEPDLEKPDQERGRER